MPASSRSSPLGSARSSRCSSRRSASSVSRWELTETYSPAAIDSAPATRPAMPAVTIAVTDAPDAATPRTRLAVERMPSFAPRTAARSQLDRPLRWTSRWEAACATSSSCPPGQPPKRPEQPPRDDDGHAPVRFELWPTAHRFARGHRIRVQVFSGAHPRYARNPGTGEDPARATRLVGADQEVFHDAARPSSVTLTVV